MDISLIDKYSKENNMEDVLEKMFGDVSLLINDISDSETTTEQKIYLANIKIFGEQKAREIRTKKIQRYFQNALHHGSIRDAMIKTKNEFNVESNYSFELNVKINFNDLEDLYKEETQCPNNSPCDSTYISTGDNSPDSSSINSTDLSN